MRGVGRRRVDELDGADGEIGQRGVARPRDANARALAVLVGELDDVLLELFELRGGESGGDAWGQPP